MEGKGVCGHRPIFDDPFFRLVISPLCTKIRCRLVQAKDFVNMRYLGKRAAYLGAIGEALAADTATWQSVEWEAFRGDARKPILVVKPAPVAAPDSGMKRYD